MIHEGHEGTQREPAADVRQLEAVVGCSSARTTAMTNEFSARQSETSGRPSSRFFVPFVDSVLCFGVFVAVIWFPHG
jgi:hypothetical protein